MVGVDLHTPGLGETLENEALGKDWCTLWIYLETDSHLGITDI